MCREPETKCALAARLRSDWEAGRISRADAESLPVQRIEVPGRPEPPELVPPQEVPRRRLGSRQGRAVLVHAITHIEFNAINLALDAVYRFRDLPDDFVSDWLRVADEEARHFLMLRKRLQELDADYGDWPAHNGLWEMAVKTDHDPLVRMALVPRVLEARGLDVTPGMMQRLRDAGDTRTVACLEIILEEEIGHVAIGSRWFRHLCAERGLEPEAEFRRLI
ncbi:MAG: DUF455 family protein, partial [Gammaproteobacteria bacterium]